MQSTGPPKFLLKANTERRLDSIGNFVKFKSEESVRDKTVLR